MINVGTLYSEFNSMYNIHQAGFFRPYDFVSALKSASLDLFNRLAGDEGRSEKINTLLEPFYIQASIVVGRRRDKDAITKPADYCYYSDACMVLQKGLCKALPGCAVWKEGKLVSGQDLNDFFPDSTAYEKVPVTKVTPNKRASVTQHVTRGPSVRKPYLVPDGDGFEVLPADLGVITIGYYRLPTAPVYNYSEREEGPDTFLDYSEEGSVHLEWSDAMRPVFLYKLGQHYNLTIPNELRTQAMGVDKIFV